MEVVNRDRSGPFITKDGSEIRSILCCCSPPYAHEDTVLVS